MATFLNFAYGSNLLPERLRQRTPSATPVSVASLAGHALRWHKRSRDGSGKCDALHTGDGGDVVWGVLYRIALAEKEALDRAEGLHDGYECIPVRVQAGGAEVEALMYSATHLDPGLQPYHWYKAYAVAGARWHGLPAEYVRRMQAVESMPDPDRRRAAANALA